MKVTQKRYLFGLGGALRAISYNNLPLRGQRPIITSWIEVYPEHVRWYSGVLHSAKTHLSAPPVAQQRTSPLAGQRPGHLLNDPDIVSVKLKYQGLKWSRHPRRHRSHGGQLFAFSLAFTDQLDYPLDGRLHPAATTPPASFHHRQSPNRTAGREVTP